MTTPKSPEQIMEDIEALVAGNFAAGTIEGSKYNADVNRKQIRSSMASLLLWAAENCSMSEKQREAEDLLFSAVKDGIDDILTMSRQAHARGYHVGQEHCRTLLIEEARKILEK